jgi:SecD/SecF fusion protein
VPVGYTVLRATSPGPGRTSDGYFVVHGNPALSGRELINPQASTDRNIRAPDVTFDFTATGRRDFQRVTRAVARRGSQVSSLGQTLNQHFAIALDNTLLSVPFIDFKQYPDGISGDHGAEVTAGFTPQSAKDVAILLRYGALPVRLTATG